MEDDRIHITNLFNSSSDNYIHIDSASCYQYNTNYSSILVNLPQPLIGVKKFKLLSFKPQSGVCYSMQTPFYLDEEGFPPVLITPPAEIYTISTIASQLKAMLENASPGTLTYTVSINSLTALITISTTSNFRIRETPVSGFISYNNWSLRNIGFWAADFIGSVGNYPISAYATSHTGPSVLNLSPYCGTDILITISSCENVENVTAGQSHINYSFIADSANLSRQIQGFTSASSYPQAVGTSNSSTMASFRVDLYDSSGNYLILQSPWNMNLAYTI